MSKKPPTRFRPKTRWVKYRDGLWIPSRKRVYLYWFKFLQHAEQDSGRKVDWKKYRGWGGSNGIRRQRFDVWWESHWKDLFGVKNEGEEPKFPLTTKKPKPDGYRTALLVYENRDAGSNWEIAVKVQKVEVRKNLSVQSFYYASPDFSEDKGASSNTHKLMIQSRVGRYKRHANQILDNVCARRFP